MVIHIFAIYDSVSEVYHRPFYLPNQNVAKRQFANMVSDPESQVSLNPADYTLFEIGTWSDQDCKFSKKLEPISLGNGVQFQITTSKSIEDT